jgi:hypothetical protein
MTGCFELREIPGLPDYFAGSDGSVWSAKRPGHLVRLTPFTGNAGYLRLSFSGKRKYSVHRLIALAFHGCPPDDMQVCHANHDKTDNRPENLSYGTRKDNAQQSVAAGRYRGKRGATSHFAKLTDDMVVEIRRRLDMGESQSVIARSYGVTQSAISDIKNGKAWCPRVVPEAS